MRDGVCSERHSAHYGEAADETGGRASTDGERDGARVKSHRERGTRLERRIAPEVVEA